MNAKDTSNTEYELQPFDVLCGRDKKCYNNIGNRRFRILINSNLPRYLRCSNRKESYDILINRRIVLLYNNLFLDTIFQKAEK